MLQKTHIQQYRQSGFTIVRALFSHEECDALREHYMQMNARGDYPGGESIDRTSDDSLHHYPRIMMPHRFEEVGLNWLIDPRINECLTGLTLLEPLAVQTMYYFKPPGARGQSLHQDQFYLRTRPGTCMAAWMAIDRCDEENGCLRIVPDTGDLPVMCTKEADLNESFSGVEIPLPKGKGAVPVSLDPGDVLFFNGQLIHGSLPNKSDRFRNTIIGHYIMGDADECSAGYHPVYRMDGTIVEHVGKSERGGPCGVWVERDGQVVPELVAQA